MKLHTFTGYSPNELSVAVMDAHRDYDQWMIENRRRVVVSEDVKVTSTIRGADVEGGSEYWFTITIIYRERQQ